MDKKEIKKLIRKSEIIGDKDIEDYEGTKFKDVDFQLFKSLKGNLYFHEEKEEFYKEIGGKWYRYTLENSEKLKINSDTEKKLLEITKWCNDFSQYVDSKLDKIEKKQNDLIQIINKLIELKK